MTITLICVLNCSRFEFIQSIAGKKQLRRAKRRSAEISETLNETVGELRINERPFELSVSELKNDSIAIPEDINPKASDSSMQKYWDEITRIDAALDPLPVPVYKNGTIK